MMIPDDMSFDQPSSYSRGRGGGGSRGRGASRGRDRGGYKGSGGYGSSGMGGFMDPFQGANTSMDKAMKNGGDADDDGDNEPEPLPENTNKQKFTGRCRLFVGNLPRELKEEEFKEMFTEHGEISECFISDKGFGFVTMDTRINAEKAKQALDGKTIGNSQRGIRVRFATHNASLRVKEIPAYVSNELLFQAFSGFGSVERALHIVDEKGRPTGEGLVDFGRRSGASDAIRRIGDGVFLLTTSPKPVYVEQSEQKDDEDGLLERMVPRNNQFMRERELTPRFATPGSFEFEFGNRWKELYAQEKQRREMLEQELQEGRERLVSEMDIAYQEYQANMLREDLRRRQEELERLESNRMQRLDELRRIRGEPANQMGQAMTNMQGMQQQQQPGYGGGMSYFNQQQQQQPEYGQQMYQRQQQFGGDDAGSQQQYGGYDGDTGGLDAIRRRLGAGIAQEDAMGMHGARGIGDMQGARGIGDMRIYGSGMVVSGQQDQSTEGDGQNQQAQEGVKDENLVHGVKKLLNMFKGGAGGGDDSGAGDALGTSAYGMPPTSDMIGHGPNQAEMYGMGVASDGAAGGAYPGGPKRRRF